MLRTLPGLFEAVPDALIVVDEGGRIEHANGNAEHLFGYPPRGLVGLDIERLMPEGARNRHRTHVAGFTAAPNVRPMGATGQTLVGMRMDGTQFPVEIALSPIDSEAGPRFLASIRDISETQRARQVIVRARYDALVASIGQLALESDDERIVIDQLPLLLADTLGIDAIAIVFASVDRDEIEIRASTGMDNDVLKALATRGATRALLSRALSTGQPLIVDDLSLQHSDDAVFPIATVAVGSAVLIPLFDLDRAMGALIASSNKPGRFDHDAMHLLQSVSNVVAALVQRRRTEDQLAHSQRLEAIGKLTGGIAHDFNNLLTVMSGSLQLLEMECADKPAAGELIASALRSVTRGAELTNKLLAFARRQRLLPQALDPRILLHDVELMLKRTLGDAIHLQVHCTEGLAAAFADPAQLDGALVNLALNARDAMPRGGEISIHASECTILIDQATPEFSAGSYVLISVSDTGHGMTPETLGRAMEPFFTTKATGSGSGFGLSMVYGFAKQSGGHLRIESALGYGTRVDLYLPVAADGATTPTPVAAPRSPATGGAS